MPYRIVDLELSEPLPELVPEGVEDGFALVGRWHGRPVGFTLQPVPPGGTLSPRALRQAVEREFTRKVLALEVEAELSGRWPHPDPGPAPSLTVAVCTKDRPQGLARLLESLEVLRPASPFRSLEGLVVDNASADAATREVVGDFVGVRYVEEPRVGLDFARNAALRTAAGDLLAFLDDDVVVDSGWLDGLYAAWSDYPNAGGYTGLVLPLRLDSSAQIEFERRGGFGRGFTRIHHRGAKMHNALHPVGVGVVGAGCNMAFDRRLLDRLGGFDEALDTGAPLPGGGDLDIFYRVIRAGRTIVYEPGFTVFHEHRETLNQLRRQYWSWGLGFMAFLTKCRRTDPALHPRHSAMLRWWFVDKTMGFVKASVQLRPGRARMIAAEIRGGIQGLLGEYDRSLERSRRIREGVA